MKKIGLISLAIPVLLVCIAMPVLAVRQLKIIRTAFSAQVTVAADGIPVVGDVSGMTGPGAQAVRSRLAARKYTPAHVDGIAVAATTYMRGTAVLTPLDNDQYSIGLEDLSFAPAYQAVAELPYPAKMAVAHQTGTVELKLRIDRDGHATVLKTMSASSADFERAVRDMVPKLRFKPQALGGQLVDVEIDLPVWFWFYGKRPESRPSFQCSGDEKLPRAEGDTGCLGMIEVVAQMVQR